MVLALHCFWLVRVMVMAWFCLTRIARRVFVFFFILFDGWRCWYTLPCIWLAVHADKQTKYRRKTQNPDKKRKEEKEEHIWHRSLLRTWAFLLHLVMI